MSAHAGYVVAIVVSSVVTAAVAGWLWRSHTSRLSRLFASVLAVHPVIGILVLGQVFAPSQSLMELLLVATYAVATPVAGLWFVTALAFANREDLLTKRFLYPVGGFYVVLVGLVVTNPIHNLVWPSFEYRSEPFAYLVPVFGAASILWFVSSLLLLASLLVLGNRLVTGSGVSRGQATVVFTGFLIQVLIPWVYYATLPPGPFNGYFVMGTSASAILVAWGAFRHDLFDLTPIARMAVFDDISEGVIVVDESGRVLDVNRAAIELFPALADAFGTRIKSLVPELVTDDGSYAEEFSVRTPEGTRAVSVDISDVKANSAERGKALIVRDVTERERHLRNLEQQTAQLEQFASTLSHDIRNPLNVAQGNLELARDGDDEALKTVEDALARIQRMIDDLMTLSREGRAIDDPEPISLSAVARDAWRTTETREATLALEDGMDVTIFADETRLRNVFENLFRNAVEHGGADATVTIGRLADGFYVEDDGPGIPPSEREQVFEYSYSTTEEGTGLGLAIVDTIANAHGWDIAVAEGDAGGARFSFTGVTFSEANQRDSPEAEEDLTPAH